MLSSSNQRDGGTGGKGRGNKNHRHLQSSKNQKVMLGMRACVRVGLYKSTVCFDKKHSEKRHALGDSFVGGSKEAHGFRGR